MATTVARRYSCCTLHSRTVGEEAWDTGVRRGKKCWTTTANDLLDRPADKVNRQLVATRPNQLWVADIMFVATWTGFVYVAFITDVFARCIVGWRVSRSLYTDMVLDALEQALWARRETKVSPS
ncbi:integrase-like protein [Nitrosomonas aestuarii]|nr:integrase-like protein [Nitrosomonas aestuarii]